MSGSPNDARFEPSGSPFASLRRCIRRPFLGTFFAEWQVGPFVLQWARPTYRSQFGVPRFKAWRDPFWRET